MSSLKEDYQSATLDESKDGAHGGSVLLPNASNDENDPLNWSIVKKHVVLAVITAAAFLPNFGASIGIPCLMPQSKQWHLPLNTVEHSLVGNLFMLGAGGIVVIILSSYFGRLPILFFSQAISLGMGIWCAEAKSFESYLGARILNGFFAVVAEAGGILWIHEIFFFEQIPKKINIWTAGIITAPYLGPLAGSFIVWHATWRWSFWAYTILNGIILISIALFADEPLYNRNLQVQPPRTSRLARLVGIEQWQSRWTRESFLTCLSRPFEIFCEIPVMALTVYIFLTFSWTVGVNATVGIDLAMIYNFTARDLGIFYVAGVIGVILGWFVGRWLHDGVAHVFARRHRGQIKPEARLFVCYPATIIMFVSLIILGFALEKKWHYMVIAVFYGGQMFGFMIANVGVNAYLHDAYPAATGEVGAWVGVGRAFGGFMAVYIEIEWVQGAGPAKVFGIQAAIVFAAAIIPTALQVAGEQIRRKIY